MDQSANDLLFETRDGIGKVTFNRPQARNAFTFDMYEGLAKICEQANGDRSLKVLVLRGAGDKAFAAGTDINQFRAFTTPEQAIDYEARLDRVLTKIEQCRVPTIAAISGACTGGGAGIAACCDLRIGTKTAKIGFPIARTLGNCLSMANLNRLSALIGPARVKDIVFTARLLGAEEAAAAGLLNEVVEDMPALGAAGRRTRGAVRQPRPAHARRHQTGAAAAAAPDRARRGQGFDPDVLYEPRFPRRPGCVSHQTRAALDRGITTRRGCRTGASAVGRSGQAVDRNGHKASEQIRMSRAPSAPRSGFALDILICSEPRVAVAIDGAK